MKYDHIFLVPREQLREAVEKVMESGDVRDEFDTHGALSIDSDETQVIITADSWTIYADSLVSCENMCGMAVWRSDIGITDDGDSEWSSEGQHEELFNVIEAALAKRDLQAYVEMANGGYEV